MMKANVEMTKARRICRSKGCEIPKYHNCLVVWTPVSTPVGVKHQKMSYCQKCAHGILQTEIKALRDYIGKLSDMTVACNMGFVPPRYRHVHRVVVPDDGRVSHMLDGDSFTSLCGREIGVGKLGLSFIKTSIMLFEGENFEGKACKRCLAVLRREGKLR